jgi:hypothetical protein
MFAAFAVVAGACSSSKPPTPTADIVLTTPVVYPTATPGPILTTTAEGDVTEFEVHLSSNGSPQTGTAVFTRDGAFSKLFVRLTPSVRLQSASLLHGKCPAPDRFEEALGDVIGGVLRRDIEDILFEDLLTGELALVINPGDRTSRTITACADLPTVN